MFQAGLYPAGATDLHPHLPLSSDSQETYDLMTLFRDPPPLWLLPAERPFGRAGFARAADR